jgi:hypothetical protein
MSASPITVIIARSVLAIWRPPRPALFVSGSSPPDEAGVRTRELDGEPDMPFG